MRPEPERESPAFRCGEEVNEIRRALDDLGAVTGELGATRGRQEAQRILEDLLGEIDELPDAIAAAIAARG